MSTFIQSGHERIGELLSRQRKYRVPTHQRDYAWTDDQVSQFWEDIRDAMESDRAEHFLGAIVFRQIEEDKDYEIIDGQQRLATALILLAVLRDIYYENNDDLWKDIQATYFGRRDRRTREIVSNFIMNSTNDEFFQRFLANYASKDKISAALKRRQTRPTNKRLLQAYTYLRDRVVSLIGNGLEELNTEPLIDLEDFLSKKLTVILVTVSDEADAFMLFETLNERGLELSILDLLKNHLFGKSRNKIEIVKQKWLEMNTNLDEKTGVRFLRHFWVSKHGRIQAGRLFRDIRDRTGTLSAVVDLADDLSKSSFVYAALSGSSDPLWEDYSEDLRRNIRSLGDLGAIQCYPVLLAAYEKLDSDDFEKTVWIMLVMAIRYSLIGGLRTGALEIRYAELAYKITREEIKRAGAIVRGLRDLYPSDRDFLAKFTSKEVQVAKHSRFLLHELEIEARADGLEPTLDPRDLNLDHIAPKTQNQHWKDIGDLADTEYEDWVARLGNQVLLDSKINRELGGGPFEKKRPLYQQSKLLLTKEAGAVDSWSTSEISKRQQRLAELAVKRWRLDFD